MTRTPSPQTTEGLGATPLTAEEEAACRVAAVEFEREPNGRLIRRLLATLDRERAAARLSVPSEALAEARETVIAKARTLLADSGRTRAISEARTALDDALYEYDAILAALPNREDAPEPPDLVARNLVYAALIRASEGRREGNLTRVEVAEVVARVPRAVVREDAPSREGLDVERLARAEDIVARRHHDPEHGPYLGLDNDPQLASMMREEAAAIAAEYAALAATPPGDREDETPPIAMPTVTHRAAVTTAEAAAGEEGS